VHGRARNWRRLGQADEALVQVGHERCEELCLHAGHEPAFGLRVADLGFRVWGHPGVELRANLKSISHRCHLFEVAFVWELTK